MIHRLPAAVSALPSILALGVAACTIGGTTTPSDGGTPTPLDASAPDVAPGNDAGHADADAMDASDAATPPTLSGTIVFDGQLDADAGDVAHLYKLALGSPGATPTVVATGTKGDTFTPWSFSPDGRTLVFLRLTTAVTGMVDTIRLDGTGLTDLDTCEVGGTGACGDGRFGADGNIWYSYAPVTSNEPPSVKVVPATVSDGGASTPWSGTADGKCVVWSMGSTQDGTKLALFTVDNQVGNQGCTSPGLHVLPISASALGVPLAVTGTDANTRVALDGAGTRVYFTGGTTLYSAKIDGSDQRREATLPSAPMDPFVIVNGAFALFAVDAGDGGRMRAIVAYPLGGASGGPVTVFGPVPFVGQLAWTP